MADSKASAMPNDNGINCTVCDTPTMMICGGCKKWTYCGKTCQTKDWAIHKILCKDIQLERKLARVAKIVHEAYLTFRENTWEGVIVKVEDKEDKLVIHDGNTWNNPQWFTKFPHNVIPNNRRAKLGVLTMLMCDEPYGFLNMLIMKLLQGLNVHLQQINFKFSHVPRKTVALTYPTGEEHSNWPNYEHSVLQITSQTSGKKWVMDFAGGQYGIVEPLHTWVKYEVDFVDKLVGVYDIGTHKHILSKLAKIPGAPTLTYGLVGRVAAKLDEAIGIWETEHKPLSTLRDLQDADFEQQKSSLLGALDKAARTFIAANDFATVVQKAQASHSSSTDTKIKMKAKQLYDEANLLLHKGSEKLSSKDRFLKEYGFANSSENVHHLII